MNNNELQRDLFCKCAELTTEIVELERVKFDHECSLKANIDNDVWIMDFHNTRILATDNKKWELSKRLEEIKNQIIEL